MAHSNNDQSLGEIASDRTLENIQNSSDSDRENTRQCGTKRKKKENRREVRRIKKVKGEAYIGHRNIPKLKKAVKQNPCETRCPNECNEFTEDDRKSIFESYWSLNHQRQRDFLLNYIDVHEIKRRRVKSESRRSLTRQYYLPKQQEKFKVCRRFFLNTLDVTDKLLRYSENNRSDIKTSKIDERGKRCPKNKTAVDDVNTAIAFINKLPAVPSHYCRKDTTRKYLPTEFKNVSNLYRMFEQYLASESNTKCKVSLQVFKKIFKKEFNIGFHVPKKDKCLTCEKQKNIDKDNVDENQQNEYNKHIKEKEVTNACFIEDQKKRHNDSTILCTSFDLQKVLGTPNGNNFLLGFSSKYAIYNLTFYESVTRNVKCYLWGECDGKRGANEICTIMYNYLRHIDETRSAKELLLYCDSCAGQNKNHQMLCLIQWFLQSSVNLEKISINFLLPGHSYMPVDSVHGTIERAHKNKVIFAPSEWPTIIRNARLNPKPYDVLTLSHKDFLDFKAFTEQKFPKTFKTESGTIVKMRMIRRAFFSKDTPDSFLCKTSYSEGTVVLKVCLPENTTRRISANKNSPQRLYKMKLPIAAKKYNGLRTLCTNETISPRYHHEFLSMPFKPNVEDRLLETDEEDEDLTLNNV